MTPFFDEIKTNYKFLDFLFYVCLLAVPIITAVLAVSRFSVGWAIGFILTAAGMTCLILKFFCTRCPHYTRDGKILKCIFFWGLPKFFDPRGGRLNFIDKTVALAAPAVILIFPLPWLLRQTGLLIIYVLSLAGFAAAVFRNECRRCAYFACPVNRAPDTIEDDAVKK